jgi:hypothetical protein
MVTLKGGPMDGWVVAPDAAVMREDWRPKFLEEEARRLYMISQEHRPAILRKPWERLSPEAQQIFREEAKTAHGDGYYHLTQATMSAVWVADG